MQISSLNSDDVVRVYDHLTSSKSQAMKQKTSEEVVIDAEIRRLVGKCSRDFLHVGKSKMLR